MKNSQNGEKYKILPTLIHVAAQWRIEENLGIHIRYNTNVL